MIFAGIDPGASAGAIAFIDGEGVPIATKNFTNWKEMYSILEPHKKAKHLILGLEEAHGYPGMSVKAVTTFIGNFGGWRACLELLDIQNVELPVRTWQAKMLGHVPKGQTKQYALKYALRRWPTLNLQNFPNKKLREGIVDALIIAEFTRLAYRTN